MQKLFIKQSLIAIFLVITLSYCAAPEEQNELPRDVNYSGSDCISIRTIRDYTPLDRSNLLIEGGRRNYLVMLVQPSIELQSSVSIGFTSHDDWLCPYGGDSIVTQGIGSRHLRIRSISRISDEQLDDILVRYGKKESDIEQAPVPEEEIKGAEVEELGQTDIS